MLLRRLIQYINIAIAVLVAVAAAALWWLAVRPLPRTSGTLRAPVSGQAAIARDRLGVPHITASSVEDALFLQGFATAQDRLWQMDAMRRTAAGELAEIAGRATLEQDIEARKLRLRRLAEHHHSLLPAHDRACLAAYARGVNHFIESNRDRLPLEFSLLGYDPRPWRAADSLLIGLQMHRVLSSIWKIEMQKLALLEGGDPARVNALFPARAGTEIAAGSNAWALSGARTASRMPILSSDPHLEWGLPSTWYIVHLKAPGLNVAGVSIPGVPAVIIGHNDRIAWGMTNLHFDVQDLYIEKLDAQSRRYLFRGREEQAQAEREWIAVRGEPNPVALDVLLTRHGPLFLADAGRLMTLRWTAAEPAAAFPFPDLNRARNFQEFRAALRRYAGPAQNFVYADADGNIGYQAAGLLPVRRDYDGGLPVDGAGGEFEWDGFIPFDQLPSSFNPPSGMIVSANENPFPEDSPYRIGGNFTPPYRNKQIRDLLGARSNWKPEEMLRVQTDVYSAFARFLARQAVSAQARRKDPDLAAAAEVLKDWNGQMAAGQPAPLIVTLLYQHLRRILAETASPGKGLLYAHQMAPQVIERLLRERPPGWFADYDKLIAGALRDAIEEGQRRQGRDVRKWDYGRWHQLTVAHPIGGRLPVVGRFFVIGTLPLSSSSQTVNQTSAQLGPSMRMNVDLVDMDRSLLNTAVGQSGHILSRHFRDQWKAYYQGTSFPMQFQNVNAGQILTVVPDNR